MLSKSVLYRKYPDGRRDITLSVDSIIQLNSIDTPDIIVKDAESNVISDSKQERLKKIEQFEELSAKYRRKDRTANIILLSFNASIKDLDNELVHLYKI